MSNCWRTGADRSASNIAAVTGPQMSSTENPELPTWWCREHNVDFASDDSRLVCVAAPHEVECPDGIPRFVPAHTYADAFGLQWKTYRRTQLDSFTGTTISQTRLRRILGERLWSSLAGARVLECGCGAGRFTEVLLGQGALVTSIDLSSAVEANAENVPQSAQHKVAQADLAALPLRPGQFDLVLCIGVIQHTPDPEMTLGKLFEQVAPGGWLAIDHYTYSLPRITRVTAPLVRRLLLRLEPDRQHQVTTRLVDLLLPLHRRAGVFARLLRRLSPITSYYHVYPELPDHLRREWALLDTHDSLTATYEHLRTRRRLVAELVRLGAAPVDCWRGGNGIEARAQKPR